MSNICYGQMERLVDWSIQHTSRWADHLWCHLNTGRGRVSNGLITLTPCGIIWDFWVQTRSPIDRKNCLILLWSEEITYNVRHRFIVHVPGVDFGDRDIQASGDVLNGLVALGDDADALSDGLGCDWVITGNHDNLRRIGQWSDYDSDNC